MPVTVAILAGGGSRRMGRDKALVHIGGVSMLERVARAALGADLPVVIVGRARPDDWPLESVRFVADEVADLGPLGGLATALRTTGTAVLALACDMPLITAEAIAWVVGRYRRNAPGRSVLMLNGTRPEPLFAVYDAGILETVVLMVEQRTLALRDLVTRIPVDTAQVPEWVAAVLRNVNTESDLEALGLPSH